MKSASLNSSAMPRLSMSEWHESGLLRRWLVVSRARVLGLTAFPWILAGLLAFDAGVFDLLRFSLCGAGLLLAHAANNQLNDLVDSSRGVDGGDYFRRQYGTQVIEDGLLSSRALLGYFLATGGIGAVAGILLIWLSGWLVAVPFLLGALLLLFYTHPLKTLGLGELAVLLVWGPLMTGGSWLAVTGTWSPAVAWLGTLCALGPIAVIFGKHIDKRIFDEQRGVRTLPVRLGETVSRWLVAAFVVAQLLVTVSLVLAGVLDWPLLLVLGASPAAWRLIGVCRLPAPRSRPADYPESVWPLWYVAHAFVYAGRFAGLFLTGLTVALLLG